MIDRGFTCIWNNSLVEAEQDFRGDFIETTSRENKEGLHTYFFSRYDNYKLITEVLYTVVYHDTVLFLWSSFGLILELDTELHVTNGKFIRITDSIIDKISDKKNVEYLGVSTNCYGESFDTFTLKEPRANEHGRYLFDNELVEIEHIAVSDAEFIDMSMNCLEDQIEFFQDEVDRAIAKEARGEVDEMSVELNENPLANEYYDKNEVFQMVQDNKRNLGDNDV